VLEALGNGAPVLYTTCPALRGLDVSRAWQVPSTVYGLREAMTAEVRVGPRDRVPEPAVEKEYGIQAVTNRLDDMYERLASRRSWRTRSRSARGTRQHAVAVGAGLGGAPAPVPAATSDALIFQRADQSPVAPVPGNVPASPAPEVSQG
jgi:hypothetical protein